MKKISIKFKNLFFNLYVMFLGLFIKRDKSVWLFGSWMGRRFADNSRFLFQYLNDNKSKYGISEVIWVTDNAELITELTQLGYKSVLKNSKEGKHWHLKAGVHVVCNMPAKAGNRAGDIRGELSAGAIRIQLWHGVGIKGVGNLRVQKQANTLQNKLRRVLLGKHLLGNKVFSPGCWDDRYQIATSEENARVAHDDLGAPKEKIIRAGYPRLIDGLALLPEEEKIIKIINEMRAGRKILLYCPTFREKKQSESLYVNPTDNKEFIRFLEDIDVLWIEKRHASSTFTIAEHTSRALYYLDSDFDINVLYKYIDVLITDYSSASSDCVYKQKIIISFIPDQEEYESDERGFVTDYEKYYPGNQAKSIKELQHEITVALSDDYYTEEMRNKYQQCRTFLYADHPSDMGWITEQILNKIAWSKPEL